MTHHPRTVTAVLIILFSIIPLLSSDAQTLEEAYRLEQEGSRPEALRVYRNWLEKNTDDPLFLEILFHAAALEPDVKHSLSFLDQFLKATRNKKERKVILIRMAQILELAGNQATALFRYKELVNLAGPDDTIFLYRYYLLRFNSGDTTVEKEIRRYMAAPGLKAEERLYGTLLLARVLFFNGSRDKGLALLTTPAAVSEFSGYPVYHYCLWDLFQSAGLEAESVKQGKILMEQFPDSVESMMVSGKVEGLSTPVDLLF